MDAGETPSAAQVCSCKSPRVSGDMRLDGLAREALGVVLGAATSGEQRDRRQAERQGDAHQDARGRAPWSRVPPGYDCRSSRTRDFLPTRPRR